MDLKCTLSTSVCTHGIISFFLKRENSLTFHTPYVLYINEKVQVNTRAEMFKMTNTSLSSPKCIGKPCQRDFESGASAVIKSLTWALSTGITEGVLHHAV